MSCKYMTCWGDDGQDECANGNCRANNGLMHIVDQVIKPLDQINATTSGSSTPSATASNTAAVSSGAAAANVVRGQGLGLMAAVGGLAMFF